MRHCVLFGAKISDHGSQNDAFVNGERVRDQRVAWRVDTNEYSEQIMWRFVDPDDCPKRSGGHGRERGPIPHDGAHDGADAEQGGAGDRGA
jgi:hypothetical protein